MAVVRHSGPPTKGSQWVEMGGRISLWQMEHLIPTAFAEPTPVSRRDRDRGVRLDCYDPGSVYADPGSRETTLVGGLLCMRTCKLPSVYNCTLWIIPHILSKGERINV